MLKSIMPKHFIAIILFLLCLLVSRPAEARLTLGVVTGPDGAAGEVALAQADSLASLLAEKLQEEVVVKTLADSATLINWLDRFAMLDLALLATEDVKANPGRFLPIGSLDKEHSFNLVARQGVAGDLPQRVGTIVRESGFEFKRVSEAVYPAAKQSQQEIQPLAGSVPVSTDEVIASQRELQHVPALVPGRAWSPQEDVIYRDILPTDEPTTIKMVLGVSPEPGGLVRTAQQAEQLATYLEQVLPISVKVREFTTAAAFAEWFMRYRMVDLAILSPALAKAKLGRDYLPVAKLLRVDKPGPESAGLVVMRRGQNEEVQLPLQRALLDMGQTERGQALMAALAVSEVLTVQDVLAEPPVDAQEPEPVAQTEPLLELAEDQAEALLPPPAKYADPVEPVAPPEVQASPQLPELPEVAVPATIMPPTERPDVAQTLPEAAAPPAVPVPLAIIEAMILPDVVARQSAPLPSSPPEKPLLPATETPTAPLELIAMVEPDLPAVVVDPVAIIPALVPEQPVVAITPPMPLEVVAPTADAAPVAPEIPVVPGAQPVQPPVEPVSVVAPPVLEEVVVPDSAAPVTEALPQATVVVAESVSEALDVPIATPPKQKTASERVVSEERIEDEQQPVVEEVLSVTEIAPSFDLAERQPAIIDPSTETWSDEEFAAILGEDLVAAVVAQPDIPQEFRPSGIPVVRPGRVARRTTAEEDERLIASIPAPLKKVEPPRLPNLLPEPDPEPGVIYVVPFVSIMVPDQVNARVFDQFVDLLNREGDALGLQFVILKEGLQRTAPEWLAIRQYVTGEIYAYVEDSSCCATDLRTKARLTYHHPKQQNPAFGFEYPVKNFFDHDRSTLDVERAKLSDDIATTLAGELLKALQN